MAKVREFQIQRNLPLNPSSSSASVSSSATPSRGPSNFLKSNVKNNKHANTSSCVSLFPPKPALHLAESPEISLGGYRRAQHNKFLKMKTSCPSRPTTIAPTSSRVSNAALSPKSASVMVDRSTGKVTLVAEENKEPKPDHPVPLPQQHLPPKLFQQNGFASSSEEEDKEMPSLKKNGAGAEPPLSQEQQPLSSSKKSNKKVAAVAPASPPLDDPTSSKPTPAKRTSSSKSTSELSFLPGQSSRSKRTIVPNKRFLSVDSPPPPRVTEAPQISPSKPSRKSENSLKKRTTSDGRDEVVSCTTATNRKRKLSSGIQEPANAIGGEKLASLQKSVKVPAIVEPSTRSPPAAVAPSSSVTNGGRPRRVIIPNRKFRDEDTVPPAHPPATPPSHLASVPQKNHEKNHVPPMSEPAKQKRRISAPKPKQQQQQNGIAAPSPTPFSSSLSPSKKVPSVDTPQASQIVFPLGGKVNGNFQRVTTQTTEDISESALVAVMEVNLEEIPTTTTAAASTVSEPPPVKASIDAGDNTSNKNLPSPKIVDENQDELLMEESEQKVYEGKSIFCKFTLCF